MRPTIDHDRLFKELIKAFFFEFVDLFFPDLAAKLDRDVLEFLDKQIFTDVTAGEKHEADLVAKVRISGQASYFLFHVEPQSSSQAVFPERMFAYFGRLLASFGMPVYPVAVLSYDSPKAEAPNRYDVEVDGWRVMAFEYRVVQLNRIPWRDYLRADNPISVALAAKMKMAPAERRKVKFECLRLLWTLKLDAARMEMIAGFIHSYLVLEERDEKWLEEEMATAAPDSKENHVLFWTHWHDKGYDKGLDEGRALALRALGRNWSRRFGAELPADLLAAAQKLDLARLDEFRDAVLDFTQESEANGWLASPPR